ncbi:retention module-containing protein [Spartinivicinus ruber]|uniref:retention module-containing protein n=1 Tax=Spartinivicinus ruber TaxID=2683272 RepID=UPI0013D68B33|nr:retention module-containing protein [Spartinivicinus ruber]
MAEQTKLQANIDQNPVGFVKKLTGQSLAVSSTGAERTLKIDDPVYPGEKVVSKSGEVLVEFSDGSSLNMGPHDQTVLSDDVIPSQQDSMDITNEAATELSTIHGAIQAGADPSQIAKEPAAGIQQASPSEGTNGIVEMARDGHETISDTGFGTGGIEASVGVVEHNDENTLKESAFPDTASEKMKSSEANDPLTSIPSNTTGKPSTTDPSTPSTTDPGTTDPSTPPATGSNPVPPVIATPIESDNIVNAQEDDHVLVEGTSEPNSQVTVTLSDGSNSKTATVTTDDQGRWTLQGKEVDLSKFNNGKITVDATATDAAGNTSSAKTAEITLDNQVPFTNHEFDLPENSQVGTQVGKVKSDDTGNVTYSFANGTQTSDDGYFQLDENTGGITLTNKGAAANLLDFENGDNTDRLNVVATDDVGNTATSEVQINITDVDEPPTVGNVELPAINEDSSIIIKPADLWANAKDPDGDSFSVTDLKLTNPTVGGVVDNGDGTWTFTPNKNYAADNVELGFTVTSTKYSIEAKATIDVIAVADAPALSVSSNTQTFNALKDAVNNPDGSIQLTAEENNKHGTAWSEEKIDLTKDFTLNFQLNFGNKDSDGADGIVFVLQNNEKGIEAVGKSGGGLGFEGLENSFGVEFDTWKNETDHDEDHAAFVNGGYVKHDKELTTLQQLDNIEDGKWHDVQITWDASEQRITYKFTNQTTGKEITDSIVRDIVNKDLGGSAEAWFGFTASTGGSNNTQSVRNVELHNSTISLDIKVAVTDDSETLGDVIISQVPTGIELSAGTNNNDGSWTLKQAELKGLFLDTQHYSGDQDFSLVIQATSSEKNGSAATTLQVINIEVNGADAVKPGATVSGSSGHDAILGDAGDDIIFASAGSDSLTGSGGADQFIWNKDAVASGTVAKPIEDHITDFNKGEDILNLKDLLEGENVDTIDDYLAINIDGKSTTIEVSPAGDDQVVQKVVLENVDLSSQYGTADSHTILQNMINDGTLIIDQ